MTDFTPLYELADDFTRLASERLQIPPADPIAQALLYAAGRLRDTLADVERGDDWWTTDRAALECDCSVAAVQYWCRNAERLGLRVRQKPSREYLIHNEDVLKMKSKIKQKKQA